MADPVRSPAAERKEQARRAWRAMLTGDSSELDPSLLRMKSFFGHLPADPRCRICHVPFRGFGKPLARLFGFRSTMSAMNPNVCATCDWVVKEEEIGVEVELTLLFADIRGSTGLAERVGPTAFHEVVDRFYRVAAEVLFDADGLIDKLVGDEIIGIFVPGIAGSGHPRRALEAARALLVATGHGRTEAPWLSIGAGVHSGTAYVGAVGSKQAGQITALGDVANTTARLASAAGPGEILLSEDAARLGDIAPDGSPVRTLDLRGRTEPISVRVVTV